MKTNQDGGSVTASDPAAAGKEMAANQTKAAGPAQTKADKKLDRQRAKDAKGEAKQTNKELGITGKEARLRVRKAKVGSKAMGALAADDKKADRLLAKEEKLGKKLRNTPSRKERNAQQARKAADEQAGPGRMGYSQKFGPGRMNGYDASAKKTMDVMTYGGASRYMAEGPGQQKYRKPGDLSRPTDYRERPAYTHTAAVDGNLTQSQIEKRGPCGGPGQRPCGTNELSAAERKVVNDGDMNNYLSRQVSNTPRGKGFQARMQSTYETNQARQRSADSSFVVGRGDRNKLSWMRDFDNNSQGGRPGGRQKGNVVGRYNAIDPDTGRIKFNDKPLDPNTGSMTMTKSKVNKPRKKA